MTTKSLPEIGREFSNRDHTTVIHSVKTIEKLKNENNEILNGISIDDMKLSTASTNYSWPDGSTLTFMQTHAGDCAFKLTLAKKARAIINNFFI